MHLKKMGWILSGLLIALPFGRMWAAELTPEQKEQHAYVQGQLDDAIKTANEACGSTIKASLNWSSLKGVDTADKSLKDFCTEAPANSLRNLCSEGDAQKARIQKIHKLVCAYAGNAGKKSAAFSQGTLSYKFEWNSDGAEDIVTAAVKKIP